MNIPQWILVTERLPTQSTIVQIIVREKAGGVFKAYGIWCGDGWERVHGQSEYMNDDYYWEDIDFTVVAWSRGLPIPEGYIT